MGKGANFKLSAALKNTHLDGHEENLGDVDHEGDVVGRVCDGIARQHLLQHGEESLNEVVQRQSALLDFKFKRLEDALKGSQGRHLVALIIRSEPVVNLLFSVLGPRGVVQLRNVVNDVFDAADDHLARLILLLNSCVKRAKNVILEHFPIVQTDSFLLPLLFVHGA